MWLQGKSVLPIFFRHWWWLEIIPKEVTGLGVMKKSELARSGTSVSFGEVWKLAGCVLREDKTLGMFVTGQCERSEYQ